MDSYSGTVIIPAMGRSERFKAAGYQEHKALINVRERGRDSSAPIIKRIAWSIPLDWQIRIIVPQELYHRFADIFKEDLGRVEILSIAGETEGQSHTVLRGLLGLNAAKPVAITDCDVEFHPNTVAKFLSTNANLTMVHHHPQGDPIYSYVRLDKDDVNRVLEVAEKNRIGSWAQSGFWRFNRAGSIHKAIAEQIRSDIRHTNGEFYLSGALNLLPERLDGYSGWTPMHSYGTPAAIEAGEMEIV